MLYICILRVMSGKHVTIYYLLPGFQLISPILQQLVLLLIQMLKLLSLILNQQVTFFILKHKRGSR